MKKLIILPAIVFSLTLAGCGNGDVNSPISANNAKDTGGGQASGIYQYPFKSAKITYSTTGTNPGESTVYIKGDNSFRESHVVRAGKKEDRLMISKGNLAYTVDLNSKKALKVDNFYYEDLKQIEPSKRMEFLKKLAVGISDPKTDTSTLKSIGTEKIAGHSCDVYDAQEYGKVCIGALGIVLKSSINLEEANVVEDTIATNIQLNIDIPDSKFEVPTGITVVTDVADFYTYGK